MSNDSLRINPIVVQGIYRHYKGGIYQVLGTALSSETQEQLIVYKSVETGIIWIRPEKMFIEQVNVDGILKERFAFLRKEKSPIA